MCQVQTEAVNTPPHSNNGDGVGTEWGERGSGWSPPPFAFIGVLVVVLEHVDARVLHRGFNYEG